jgi:ABC-2 type transport system ATP-binding protein
VIHCEKSRPNNIYFQRELWMSLVIDCKGLSFRYDGVEALKDFSLSVERGEVMALLGPNGAGKTTSIRVLTGLLPARSGLCSVLGEDPARNGAQIRARSGVLTETPALYERLTGWQNLEFFGALAGLSREEIKRQGDRFLEVFKLSGRANDRVETYSKGMKQRLALARALLHGPELLFLDEPTSDLDPEAARQVHDLILEVSGQSRRTVLLCTHRLYEAERLCSRVAIMREGEVMAIGTLDELRRQILPEIRVEFRLASPPQEGMHASMAELAGVRGCEWTGSDTLNAVLESEEIIPDLVVWLVSVGARLRAVEPQLASLEEIYLRLQQNHQEEEK